MTKYVAYDANGVIVANYDSEDSPVPDGVAVIAVTFEEYQACLNEPLYRVVDGVLTPPSDEVLIAREERVATATRSSERDTRLAAATARIAPLQDAVDLDEATAAEVAALKAWKQYRVALSRFDPAQTPPQWPLQPS